MTPKEKDGTDVDAVQISSSKELDAEVASFLAAFRDKETEYNWEARDRSLTRLRGILRGNATEKYHDALMLGVRQMVDGIIKAIESLRTSLALNALNVVAEIGIYLGKSVDAYIYDRLLDCLFKCASTTKKVIASASLKATTTFISHATYHHKLMNMLGMMMNEKNNQVRLFTVTYTKTVLQAHAHRDHTRAVLDRTGGTDILVKILEKGLSDATPAVRENCRDAFWIFHENWKERGENLLRSLQPAIRKAVEKSKAKAVQNHRSIHSPTNSSSSLHTSSSLGSHRNISDIHDALSPSTSTASNGSSGSSEPHPTPDIRKTMTRSVSPRASSPSIRSTSPHLLRSFGSPPPTSWQLHSSHAAPSSPPPSTSRKTRVPTLTRKKSTISTKRKLSLFSMLSHDDLSLRCDGLRMLARKLAEHPYSSSPDLQSIQLESTHGVLDGEKLKTIVWNMLQEDNARLYEALSGWDAVAGVLVKLLTFEELIPKLILDATADAVSLRTDDDITRHEAAISAFKRVKVYLKRYDPNLANQLLTALIMTSAATPKRPLQSMAVSKKDPMRNPANRRKLTSKYLEWMDELVTPILGLDGGEDTVVDEPESKEWIADAPNNVASQWFESDAHVRQYLEQLLPLVSTSTPGSIVHEPLISLVGHLRLVNQKLFETIAGTFDSKTITKISRILGIHIRVIPDYVCQSSSPINDESLAAVQGNEQEVQTTEIAQELAEEEEQQHVVEQREIPEQMQEEEEEEEEEEVDEEPPKVNQVPPTAYSPDNDTTDPTITTEQPKSTTMRVEHTTAIKTIDDTYEHDTESPVQNVPLSEIPEVHDERFVPESTPAQAVISPAHFDPRLDDLNIPDTTPYDNRPLVLPLGSSEYMLPKMRPFESNGTTESQHHPADFVAPNSPPAAAAGLAALNTEQSIASHSISTAAKRRPYENNITHVPYFAPSQVSEPWPTLKENKRSDPSTVATNGRSTRDKTSTLYALVDKLKSMTIDNATVRKLTRLAREAPVMQPWDQGGSEEPGSDLWAGAEANGGNFVEVVQGAILYLDGSQKTLTVLELVRQLASTQGGLFRYCERRVDEQGMSLEARLMERLLAVRASPDASVSTAAEDALDSLIRVLDPMNVFEILLSFLAYQLCISPMSNEQQMAHMSRYHPLGSAFTYLGKCVQEVRDTFFVEEWLIKAGAVVFLKGLNHPSIHVRKSCVETIVQFHGVMGDDIYQFLDELRTDQVNLVRHYVSRAIKKAGARSLSGTPVI